MCHADGCESLLHVGGIPCLQRRAAVCRFKKLFLPFGQKNLFTSVLLFRFITLAHTTVRLRGCCCIGTMLCCVCVCVGVIRVSERQRARKSKRKSEREKLRESERERAVAREGVRGRKSERAREKESKSKSEKETERERKRERTRKRERKSKKFRRERGKTKREREGQSAREFACVCTNCACVYKCARACLICVCARSSYNALQARMCEERIEPAIRSCMASACPVHQLIENPT